MRTFEGPDFGNKHGVGVAFALCNIGEVLGEMLLRDGRMSPYKL